MSRIIVELDQAWSGDLPPTAWILGIGPINGGGQSIGFACTAGRKATGKINILAELQTGPGNKPMPEMAGSNRNKPTALSLCASTDVVVGIVLDPKLGAVFSDLPFSGGYAGADSDYLSATRVSDRTAYLVIPASRFGGSYEKPFNIHLEVDGKTAGGMSIRTSIILDPDTRLPPPGYGPL